MQIISLSIKASDLCAWVFMDDKEEYTGNGYPPKGMSICDGDYVTLSIDAETGKVLNWKFDAEEFIEKNINHKES